MTTTELTAVARTAGEHVTDETWVQGAMGGPGGSHCAHGWVRACAPTPGDEQLVRAAMRHRGLDEAWNDDPGRTAAEVAAALAGLDVDAALADLWGDAAPAVVRVVQQAGSLTEDQAARVAARNAARGAAWDAARNAAWGAARVAAWDAAWYAGWDATWGAAGALVVADLVGTNGLTQDHIDALLAPWITVMGDPR